MLSSRKINNLKRPPYNITKLIMMKTLKHTHDNIFSMTTYYYEIITIIQVHTLMAHRNRDNTWHICTF